MSAEKAERISAMFDRIAWRYDLLNRLLSFGIDRRWRREVVKVLPMRVGMEILDVATGTGDLIVELASQNVSPFPKGGLRGISPAGSDDQSRSEIRGEILPGPPLVKEGVGIDISDGMLEHAAKKIVSLGLTDRIILKRGDATNIDFPDKRFDVVTIAFGIRNVTDPDRALFEMKRVLKIGGRAIVLEFSMPRNRWVRFFYLAYFRHILPVLGGAISKDRQAYRYLNKTVEVFPEGEKFCNMLKMAGLENVGYKRLTFGIATIYWADRIA